MLFDWYNIELKRDLADALTKYLKERNYLFEPSEAYNLIHFEIFMTEDQANEIEEFLTNLEIS